MEMLETSAKSGENVLAAFEKLIGIVHDRALAASKNKGGINGMHTASTTTSQAQQPIKLDDKAANDNSAAACGCLESIMWLVLFMVVDIGVLLIVPHDSISW
jgi:hypothetical protein